MQEYYTITEASKILGFSRFQIYNQIKAGDVKAKVMGFGKYAHPYVSKKEVERIQKRIQERGRYWCFRNLKRKRDKKSKPTDTV